MKLAPDLLLAIGLAGWLFWLWRRDRRELEMYRASERARNRLGRSIQ